MTGRRIEHGSDHENGEWDKEVCRAKHSSINRSIGILFAVLTCIVALATYAIGSSISAVATIQEESARIVKKAEDDASKAIIVASEVSSELRLDRATNRAFLSNQEKTVKDIQDSLKDQAKELRELNNNIQRLLQAHRMEIDNKITEK